MSVYNIFPYIRIKLRTISFYFKHKLLMPSISISKCPIIAQRITCLGSGAISIGSNVLLGTYPSAGHKNGEFYLEARNSDAAIVIGNNVCINNGAIIISNGSKISIGNDTLIGPNFTCFDSDFHSISPLCRRSGKCSSMPVFIGDNVFIGANVTILKGSNIGKNSVIGAGCVIRGVIPENVVVSSSDNLKVVSIHG